MYKGIKPTRLWYLSGKKHIESWIRDRQTSWKGYDYDQRINYDMLKLIGIVYGTALGFVFSYGFFSPEKYSATIKRTSSPTDCMKPCGVEVPQPCPADNKKK